MDEVTGQCPQTTAFRRWGTQREIIYLTLRSHHQNDSRIKMGSDESYCNVLFIVRNSTCHNITQCPQTTDFLREREEIEPKTNRIAVLLLTSLKPVLNWANVCSPNIIRTVRRTMIRFLIELLVRRTWFGQFEEFTYSQLANCNEMQASARTCGRRAAGSMIENVG